MQHKHKYVFIFGTLSIFYLLIMIVVGSIKDNTSNAANRKKTESDKVHVITGSSVERTEILYKVTSGEEKVSEKPVSEAQASDKGRPELTQASDDRQPELTQAPQTKEEMEKSAPVHTAAPTAKPTVAPTAKPTENPLFRDYKGLSSVRKEVVNAAQSYAGKITYLWGGKASDSDISGKTNPKKLDCSGFIQFVFSKHKGKRIDSLGATISISGLTKIGKSALKPGDIGLKRGTGSLYYDADGKEYAEPEKAERANKRKVREAKELICEKTDRINVIDSTIEEKKEKIQIWKEGKKRVYKKAKKLGVTGVEADEKTFICPVPEGEHEQKLLEKYQEKYVLYKERVDKCRESIKDLRIEKGKCPGLIKDAKKAVKKYGKKIKKRIDHVGIYCGKDQNGREIWCHCSSSKKGVRYEHTDMFKYYFRYFKNS